MESLTNSSNKLWFPSIKMFFDQRNFTYHHTNAGTQTNVQNVIDFFQSTAHSITNMFVDNERRQKGLALLKSWLFANTGRWHCAGADPVLRRCLAIHKCWLFASTEKQYCAGVQPVPPQRCANAWHSADRQHWHYSRVTTGTVPRRL